MEDKYLEGKDKFIIAMIILYMVMLIGVNIYYYKTCTGRLQLEVSAIDGIVSFMIDNRNIIGTELLFLALFLFYQITPNLNDEHLCLYKSRTEIYLIQLKQTFYMNLIFTIGNAVISFLVIWMLTGTVINWDSKQSIYYLVFERLFYKNFLRFEMYIVGSILACICIVQFYLMLYLMIYWMMKSRNITFFCCIIMSWCMGRPIIADQYKFTSNIIYTIHYMVQDKSIAIVGLLKYIIGMLVTFAITYVLIKRKDFL